uniref:Uncharacterized protein n=1 Tax=Vannella robusta TaxID=1487602 RepID=A0A7S4HPV2_9EUKA
MVGAPLKTSFRPSLHIMHIIRTHGPLSRREIFKHAAEQGIAKSNSHCGKMLDFLVRFGKVKVRANQGTRYLYSEKHPQKGYPLNPYNYEHMHPKMAKE